MKIARRAALRRATRWHQEESSTEKEERLAAERLVNLGKKLNDPEAMRVSARKMKEMERLGLAGQGMGRGAAGLGMTDERDKGTYMREKKDKFGVTDGKFGEEIKGQKGGAKQQKARDIAVSMNPFEGNVIGGFMDYVENEQDYYQRGQTAQQALALSRERARSAAKRSASEARTAEVLGRESVNTLKTGKGSYHDNKLLVNKWDMNSFTLSNGVRAVGSIIIFRDNFYLWDVASPDDITMEKLMPIAHFYPVPKFLILGMGMTSMPLHPDIMMYMRSRGTRIDFMPTERAIANHHHARTDDYPFATALLCLEPTNGFDFYAYNQYWKRIKDSAHGLTRNQRDIGDV